MAPAPGPRGVAPTKQIVPLAPPTDSHHDDRTPVIQTTGPQDLESAGRGYRRDPDQVLTRTTSLGRKRKRARLSLRRPDRALRALN
jgi:hypothetical protein